MELELELEEAAQADKEQQEERCLPTSAASISYATPSEQPPPYGLLSLIVVQVVHEYICYIFIYICLSECERERVREAFAYCFQLRHPCFIFIVFYALLDAPSICIVGAACRA